MLLSPRNFKYRKHQKGKSFNKVIGGSNSGLVSLKFGSIGLKALSSGRLTAKQINSVRQSINKQIKKLGRLKVNIFPHTPITKKPVEVRMGKGKGAPEYWAAVVKPGRIMFELDGVPLEIAREALRLAAQKLPITTKFVVRRDYV